MNPNRPDARRTRAPGPRAQLRIPPRPAARPSRPSRLGRILRGLLRGFSLYGRAMVLMLCYEEWELRQPAVDLGILGLPSLPEYVDVADVEVEEDLGAVIDMAVPTWHGVPMPGHPERL